ncbi:MAG: DsbA family oxidoreductase [Woeseia sp.]|nr:DsbA family oxidoreductase [Woeseia sp.]NNL54124.1 DsbA family oxidoreductase [Woeseia sp.]
MTSSLKARDDIAAATLRVSLIADLICPWCFLGKRRLNSALSAVQGPREIRWLPFQLNPGMPANGMSFEQYLSEKFGDPTKIQPGLDALTEAGRAENIHFRFDLLKRVPNTLNAHQLLQFAQQEGASTVGLAEDLLSDFFEEGLDIADRDVLVEAAGNRGLSRQPVLLALENDAARSALLEKETQIRRGGVSGVPNFLVNDRLLVIGAQPAEVLIDAFDRAMFGEESDQPVSSTFH